ncbi:MAG: hypothetical protein KIT02_06880 [Devosia sp.]|uniref:hypothetical protein n=1 Tax=Devosia sp. TaxID=1871048 RepID=UPI0024CA9628|nr:hypothetical protein [Devosia sp.]UYO00919.1 MAG: hypothetical protein KIT02_06880 [Devosia sp.]
MLALALCAAPSLGQEDPWGLRLQGGANVARQDCDRACQQARLVCVVFSHAGSKAFRAEDLTDDRNLPWGQIDFAMLASMVSDRKDIDPSVIADGSRRSGPQVVSFADHDWVHADYDFVSGSRNYAITLLLWPDKSVTRGLRCSYAATSDPADQIRAWAGEVRR